MKNLMNTLRGALCINVETALKHLTTSAETLLSQRVIKMQSKICKFSFIQMEIRNTETRVNVNLHILYRLSKLNIVHVMKESTVFLRH